MNDLKMLWLSLSASNYVNEMNEISFNHERELLPV